jgi:hypothetical protein
MATTTPPRTTPRRRRTVLLLVAALAVLVGILSACGAPGGRPGDAPSGAPPRQVDSVGRIDGSTALVAVLARGDEVTAYVCDGDTTTGERFSGTLLGDRAVLHSAGGAQLAVDVSGDGASGIFTPAGAPAGQAFTTTPSTGSAGWYAAEAATADGPVSANWIVLADGTQTGFENGHKHKHRGHKLHFKPKPSGVSPKPGDGLTEPEGQLVEVLGADRCAGFPGGVCPVRALPGSVELDGGLVVKPVRRELGTLPALSGDPQSLAGS